MVAKRHAKVYRELFDDAVETVVAQMEDSVADQFRQQAAEWKAWSCKYDTQHPFEMQPNNVKNFLRGKKKKESWLMLLWLILDTFAESSAGADFENLAMILLQMSVDAKNGKVMGNDYPTVELPEEAPVVYKDFALRNPELLFKYTPPPVTIEDPEVMAEINVVHTNSEARYHPNTRLYMHWCNMFRAVAPVQSRDYIEDVLFDWEYYCNNWREPRDPLELWEYRFVEWFMHPDVWPKKPDRDMVIKYFSVMYRFVKFLAEENAFPLAHEMLQSLENYKDEHAQGINNNWPDLVDARDRALRCIKHHHPELSVRKLSKLTWAELKEIGEPFDHDYQLWERIARHASPWVFPLITNGTIRREPLKRQAINYLIRGLRNPEAGGYIENPHPVPDGD